MKNNIAFIASFLCFALVANQGNDIVKQQLSALKTSTKLGYFEYDETYLKDCENYKMYSYNVFNTKKNIKLTTVYNEVSCYKVKDGYALNSSADYYVINNKITTDEAAYFKAGLFNAFTYYSLPQYISTAYRLDTGSDTKILGISTYSDLNNSGTYSANAILLNSTILNNITLNVKSTFQFGSIMVNNYKSRIESKVVNCSSDYIPNLSCGNYYSFDLYSNSGIKMSQGNNGRAALTLCESVLVKVKKGQKVKVLFDSEAGYTVNLKDTTIKTSERYTASNNDCVIAF